MKQRRRGVTEREIRHLAGRIGKRFGADRVILFGSYAYGHPTPDSDVDFLVVLRTRRDPTEVATDIACETDPDFPLDVLVKTPEEIRWRLAERESFMSEVWERGKVLYEAGHARVG